MPPSFGAGAAPKAYPKRAAASTDPHRGDVGELCMTAALPFPLYWPGTGNKAEPAGACWGGADAGGAAAARAAGGGTFA